LTDFQAPICLKFVHIKPGRSQITRKIEALQLGMPFA